MSNYKLYEHLTAAFQGGAMDPEFIAIHWWGLPGQTSDVHGTAQYLTTSTSASTHFVTSAGVVYCLVSPTRIAWGQGDGGGGYGNNHGISIENNPYCRPEDRETTAQLIAQIRMDFGKNFPLRPHKNFVATQCPGVWEQWIPWLDARANQIIAERKGQAAPVASTPAPVAPASPAPAQSGNLRTVTNDVAFVRVSPNASSALVSKYPNGIAKGAVIAVEGFVAGQDPYPADGIQDDAWYKTASGYIWANAAGNNIAGLPNLTPANAAPAPAPAPAPAAPQSWTRRVTSPTGVTVRTGPGTNYPVAPSYPHGIANGATIAVVGFVSGQDPIPNDGVQDDAWYKTISGLYIWTNGAEDNLSGLPKLN